MDIVCNVDDMTDINGTWIVSFYDSATGCSAGYDSTEFSRKLEAVSHAKTTKQYAERCEGDRMTIVIGGNG